MNYFLLYIAISLIVYLISLQVYKIKDRSSIEYLIKEEGELHFGITICSVVWVIGLPFILFLFLWEKLKITTILTRDIRKINVR